MRPTESSPVQGALPTVKPAAVQAASAKAGAVVQKAMAAAEKASMSADALLLKKKGIEVNKPLIKDTLWYRFKRKVLDVISNIDLPFLRSHKLGDKAPEALKAKMQPGDILLRRTDWTSGNLLIPSFWKHAAVYTGDGNVIEATFKGVQKNSLDQFFEHGDDVMVIRPKDMTDEQRQVMIAYARAQVGRPYDFDMDFDDDRRLSCTEVAAQTLRAAGKKDYVEEGFFGEIVGDYFLNDHFDLLYTTRPDKSQIQTSA